MYFKIFTHINFYNWQYMYHFIADPHFDHDGVLEMSGRPFSCVNDHNNYIKSQINKYVMPNHKLFILGDVAWYGLENHLKDIVCKDIHLIWGNHDKCNFGKLFKSQQDVLEIKLGDKPNQVKLWMSHYPHAYWPSSHHGAMHIYGHMHRQREEFLDACFPGRRSMDVGIDNARWLLGEYRPFTDRHIMKILGSRPGHDNIDFYKEYQLNMPKISLTGTPLIDPS